MAADGQADGDRGAHAERIGADERPRGPVARSVGPDRTPAALELHPGRRRAAAAGGIRRDVAVRRSPLEREPLARGNEHEGLRGAGRRGAANHHAGLGPRVDELDGGDAGDDVEVAAGLLERIVEGVGRAPDVSAGAADRERAVALRGTAGDADGADVLRAPS